MNNENTFIVESYTEEVTANRAVITTSVEAVGPEGTTVLSHHVVSARSVEAALRFRERCEAARAGSAI